MRKFWLPSWKRSESLGKGFQVLEKALYEASILTKRVSVPVLTQCKEEMQKECVVQGGVVAMVLVGCWVCACGGVVLQLFGLWSVKEVD